MKKKKKKNKKKRKTDNVNFGVIYGDLTQSPVNKLENFKGCRRFLQS